MDWIVASFIMFLSSVGMYLLVRKCSLLKISSAFQSLAMFLVPLPLYLFLAWTSNISLQVTWYQLLILAVTAILFSYFGNNFSLKSIKYAPNPGYSLILSKSYVVFTTVVAVFVFHGHVSVRTMVAIALIVIASALVMIGRPRSDQSHVRRSWLPLAVGSFFCWGMLAISSKYLLDIGVPIYTRLIWVMTIVTCLIVAETKSRRGNIHTPTMSEFILLVLIGIFSASFNYFMQLGFQLAPNIGYVNAINASSISAIALFSALFFGDELTKQKFVGIIGVTIGLILLVT